MPRQTARDLRQGHRALVLRSLFFDGATSRFGLAGRTGLSQATISTLVGELLGARVVEETGQLASEGGRPATLVAVRAAAAGTIGVDVGETGIKAELFDLALQRLTAREVELDLTAATPAGTAEAVLSLVDVLLEDAREQGISVLGVGVGIPGVVDERDETIVHIPSLNWTAVAFRSLLSRRGVPPVMLDNGAKTLGRAESWFGAGRGTDDLVVALVGTGVGAAIIKGGSVYRGWSSSAGEWGHITIQTRDGDACRCGNNGCLEAYIGSDAVARRWRTANPGFPAGGDVEAIRALAAAAERGDPNALHVVEETAEYFAAGLGTLANLLNPARVVIGGWVGLALGEHLLAAVRRHLVNHSLAHARDGLDIRLSRFGPDAVALGAALLPVERFLADGGRIVDSRPVPVVAADTTSPLSRHPAPA